MSETESERRRRLRWITFGELIALAALAISAAGLWISWKHSGDDDKPTRVVEQRQAIPLALRVPQVVPSGPLTLTITSSGGVSSIDLSPCSSD